MMRLKRIVDMMVKIPHTKAHKSITNNSDTTFIEMPKFHSNKQETLKIRKARLLYQSRNRAMLENDLILSTFAKKYLDGFNERQTIMYDEIINSASDDWDLFYWIVEKIPTPKRFDNEIMDLLKQHARNDEKELRTMPDLIPKPN